MTEYFVDVYDSNYSPLAHRTFRNFKPHKEEEICIAVEEMLKKKGLTALKPDILPVEYEHGNVISCIITVIIKDQPETSENGPETSEDDPQGPDNSRETPEDDKETSEYNPELLEANPETSNNNPETGKDVLKGKIEDVLDNLNSKVE
ncbi:hypothetical protein COEREDRAFT_89257 [Coemansia reversa NRRL 1564]|uniref:Uncharacterized protein n=1 Tax=Coemansia reversa (strain ATCC 12441 / NRRL 1564) TaxID=763665 RepID=A0A2G5B459_COERN|nr:hypothetical protein COEREDRAFT_89257 [Coemansia reversa NRRL 1564]|eukprot:PIA13833.1 hypothetical protein COEREDRAFT_89257 [Coemansia reversa NRRL 1564]